MIIERLKEYIDFKGISIAAFERSVGMANASFGKSLKNHGAIGSDKLEKILNIYSDISPVWLLSGKGDMIATNGIVSSVQEADRLAKLVDTIATLQEVINAKSETIATLTERIQQLENQLKNR